jgi:hypothetical protein
MRKYLQGHPQGSGQGQGPPEVLRGAGWRWLELKLGIGIQAGPVQCPVRVQSVE